MNRMRTVTAMIAATALIGLGIASPASAATRKPVVLTFAAKLTNISDNTQTYGDLQYGTTELVGASLVNGEEVKVIRNATIEYVKGSGPIGGFLTVIWKDDSRISMRVTGKAVNTDDAADFTGALETFSTSGRWSGYVGKGTMRAHRTGPVGNPVVYSYRVTLLRTTT